MSQINAVFTGNMGNKINTFRTKSGKPGLGFSINISNKANSPRNEGWLNCATANEYLIENILDSRFSREGERPDPGCALKGARVTVFGNLMTRYDEQTQKTQTTFWVDDMGFMATFYPMTIVAPRRVSRKAEQTEELNLDADYTGAEPF